MAKKTLFCVNGYENINVGLADLEILMNHWLEDKNPVSIKVIDGVEFRVQTDKNFYHLGESVQMSVSVTNKTNETVLIRYYQIPGINFLVKKDEETIWQWAYVFLASFENINLSPGQSDERKCIWNMKDDWHYLIEPGTYQVGGEIYLYAINDAHYYDTYIWTAITVTAEAEH
jgi:hypothetical protein